MDDHHVGGMTLEHDGKEVLANSAAMSQQFVDNKPVITQTSKSQEGFPDDNLDSMVRMVEQEENTNRHSFNFDVHIEHNKQSKMLAASLEMQHAQLEQVNEIIQEQNEMITQLRDLYRIEIAKQINEVALMKQFSQQQSRRNTKGAETLGDSLRKGVLKNGKTATRDPSPDTAKNGKKGKTDFVVDTLEVRDQQTSEQGVLGALGTEAQNLNAEQPVRIKMMRSKEPEPEDGDIMSEANASKKRQ